MPDALDRQFNSGTGVEICGDLRRRIEELEESLASLANVAKHNSLTLAQIKLDRHSRIGNPVLFWLLGAVATAACVFCLLITKWFGPH